MNEYRKTATVKAKLFEQGDEDGMIHRHDMIDAMEDAKFGLQPDLVPYISTKENQYHRGEFGKHYVCVGIEGERWLVEKEIFEKTYEQVKKKKVLAAEPIPEFHEALANMSDYDKGRVDGRLAAISNDDNIYHAMDYICIESLEPKVYEMWLHVLNNLSLSREKAKAFVERMGY